MSLLGLFPCNLVSGGTAAGNIVDARLAENPAGQYELTYKTTVAKRDYERIKKPNTRGKGPRLLDPKARLTCRGSTE